MTSLVEFLRARLDERAAPGWELVPYTCPPGCCAPEGFVGHRCLICDTTEYGGTVEAITEVAEDHDGRIHQRPLVVAEVEAKRRIIDLREAEAAEVGRAPADIGYIIRARLSAYDAVIRSLALPYADHPDFDPGWTIR